MSSEKCGGGKSLKVRRQPAREEIAPLPSRSMVACLDAADGPSLTLYTQAEQHFSTYVQRQLLRLLKGEEDSFRLMRHYYARQTMSFFLPARLDKREIRVQAAQRIIYSVFRFLDPCGLEGPIAQQVKGDRIIETRIFSTQYPHIIIERTDQFKKSGGRCVHVEWRAVCLRNRSKSALVHRALEVGNLALEIARLLSLV